MKILIVDDSAAVRSLLRRLLMPLATEIRECVDGIDAPAAYEAQSPDLVLMDIRMKQADGITATKLIKAANPAANIIIVTDYDDDALREAAMQAGACGYALKENLPDLVCLLEEMQQNKQWEPGTPITDR